MLTVRPLAHRNLLWCAASHVKSGASAAEGANGFGGRARVAALGARATVLHFQFYPCLIAIIVKTPNIALVSDISLARALMLARCPS